MTAKEVRDWIIQNATGEDCADFRDAIDTRKEILLGMLSEGAPVELVSISPKYLIGLKGNYEGKRGGRSQRVMVLLDEVSTTILRAKGGNRYHIPKTTKRFKLIGIPKTCIKVLERAEGEEPA